MKNFFKKLSFVLAIAMVLTTVVPATASAAGKNYMELNGKKVTSVTAWIGGVTRNLDYNVGGKTSGVKGTWKVGNTSVATINAYGVVTPVANGTTKVRFTPADNSGAVTITLKVRTRAAALHVYDPVEYEAGTKNQLEGTTVELNAGETKNLKVTMPISKKAVAAGGVGATYFLYAQVSDETVVSATAGTNNRSVTLKGLAAGEATVTLLANQTTGANVKSNKYYKEASFTVKVNEVSELSAKQVGANTIEVKGKDLTDKVADYTLKLGTATKSLDKAVKNEDGSVTLTTATSYIADGTYTLTFGSESVELACEKAKVSKITVDPESAILKADDKTTAYIYYKVLNQFGEDVTEKNTTLTVTTSAPNQSLQANKKRIEISGYTSELVIGMAQISVSIVDTTTGVAYTGIVTVADASRLTEIELIGIYDVGGTKKYDTLEAGLKATDAQKLYMVFAGKDQYGIDFDPTAVTTSNFSLSIASVTGLKYNDNIATIAVNGETYFGAQLTVENSSTSNKLAAGDANYTAIVLTSGKTVTGTVSVTEKQKIVSLTVTTADTVYGNKVATLNYTALDQDGNEITDITVLKRMNHGYSSTYGFQSDAIYFAGSKGGKAVLYFDYDVIRSGSTVLTSVSPQSMTWITENMTFGSLIINVYADRYPTAVVGVWPWGTDSTYADPMFTALAENNTITLTTDYLKYEDQYGNLFKLGEFAEVVAMQATSDLKIDAVEVTGSAENLTITTPIASSVAIAAGVPVLTAAATGTSVTTQKIVKITSSYQTASMSKEASNTSNVTYYGVNDSDVTYTISTGGKLRSVTDNVAEHNITGTYGSQVVKTTEDTNYTDATAPITVLGAYSTSNNATGKGTLVVTNKESGVVSQSTYEVANAPAVAQAASLYGYFGNTSGHQLNYAFMVYGYATIAPSASFTLNDAVPYGTQYYDGDDIDDDTYIVTFSDLPDEATVTNNGKKTAAITFDEAGWYTVDVTVTWNSGLVYTETICLKQN